jgi:DNA-binding NarL/FixJ family response regulator
MKTATIRIVIVDDHPLVRDGLKARLNSRSDWKVCAEVETVADAVSVIRKHSPDVAIVDLSLREGSGLALVQHLATVSQRPRILVCSMHDESLYARRAIQAGAMGFLHKQQAADCLIPAIEKILAGKLYVSEKIADALLLGLARPRMVSANVFEQLTNRELALFELIGRGYTLAQIAKTLHLSIKTVETYRERAKKKLGLRTSAELLRCAVKWVGEHASE